jgi:Prolyl oligopeptidase family
MRCLTRLLVASALCVTGCAADTVKSAPGSVSRAPTGGLGYVPTAGSAAHGPVIGAAGSAALGAPRAGSPAIPTGPGISPPVLPKPGGAAGAPSIAPPPPPIGNPGGPVTPPPPAAGSGSTMTGPPVTTAGDGPTIPAPMGDCPDFKTGTATIAGLAGISLQVGTMSDTKGAMLFYWHGTGSSAVESAMFPGNADIVAKGGIVVAMDKSGGKGSDCSGTGTFSEGDFDIADLIVSCGVKNHNIDPRKIYTTGCSAGGLQAGCMAEMRSSYIAASVPNSGGAVFPMANQDKHTPALMTMHGNTTDDVVIVKFAETSKSLDDAFVKTGGFVMDCDHGGGHCGAPAALQSAGYQFMQDHPFGVSPEPYAAGLPSVFPMYCMVLSK